MKIFRKIYVYLSNYIFKPKKTLLEKLFIKDYKNIETINISLDKIDFRYLKLNKYEKLDEECKFYSKIFKFIKRNNIGL